MHVLEILIPIHNLKDYFSVKGFCPFGAKDDHPDVPILNLEGGRRFGDSYSPRVVQGVSLFASPFLATLDLPSLDDLPHPKMEQASIPSGVLGNLTSCQGLRKSRK